MSHDTADAALTGDRTERLRSEWDPTRAVRGTLGLVAFVAVWWAAAATQPEYVLPGPGVVAATFLGELTSGALTTALRQSVVHWIPGTVAGTLVGVSLGVALGWSDAVDDALAPVVRVLRPVPPLALIGFAIAWFGLNHAGAAFVIAMGALWINFYAAYGGVRGVSEELVEVATSLGVTSDRRLLRTVVIPDALPEILTGVRTGIGRCWMLVVAAEIFGAPGVGRNIMLASNNLAVDVVIAYILVLSLVYLVVDASFRALQGRVLAWQN